MPEPGGLLDAWRAGIEKEPAMRAFPMLVAQLQKHGHASPAAIGAIGRSLGILDLADGLHSQPGTEWDRNGNLTGLGLTSRPTHHRYVTAGRVWYAWCALDTLILPAILGHEALVDSRCHATGAPINVVVSAQGVRRADPAEAVVSLVPAADLADIREKFCHNVHFFASRQAAKAWIVRHPQGSIVSLAEAFALGRDLTRVFARA